MLGWFFSYRKQLLGWMGNAETFQKQDAASQSHFLYLCHVEGSANQHPCYWSGSSRDQPITALVHMPASSHTCWRPFLLCSVWGEKWMRGLYPVYLIRRLPSISHPYTCVLRNMSGELYDEYFCVFVISEVCHYDSGLWLTFTHLVVQVNC